MFSNTTSFWLKIMIAGVVALIISMLLYYIYTKEKTFNVISIKEKLTSGSYDLFKTEIKWVEDHGKIMGNLEVSKMKYNVYYILQTYSVEAIVSMEKSLDIQDRIPCLNIIHLLSRDEVKKFYESIFKHSKIEEEGYKIPISNKLFIDFFKKNNKEGLELHCKMYYIN